MTREETIEKKYKTFINFCEDNNGRFPKYNSPNEKEAKLYRFYTNKKNILTRGQKGITDDILPKWEEEYINQMDEYKETISEKMDLVLDFCKKYNKVPSYTYKKIYTGEEQIEREVYKKYSAIKTYQKNYVLSEEEQALLNMILTYRNKRQLTRIEKIKNILDFSIEKKVTPRQHSDDKTEKKLGEFFNSVKTLKKTNKLQRKEIILLNKILKFAPVSKESVKKQKLKNLTAFIKTHKKLPKNKKGSSVNEKKLASFYVKLNWLDKQGKISDSEAKIINYVHKKCNVKTRYEKIEDLHLYIEKKKFPNLNSTNNKERKLAVFFNNLKNAKKHNRLNKKELALLKKISKLQKATA